ncbi:MAG: uL30 family ribosomal protein [Nanoarchaeota archaeon]
MEINNSIFKNISETGTHKLIQNSSSEKNAVERDSSEKNSTGIKKEINKSRKFDSKPIKDEKKSSDELLAVIRISGMVGLRKDISGTLDRLRLRRKYSCVLVINNENIDGMLNKVKYYVAYGAIDRENLIGLINKRGRSLEGNKKKININAENIAKELINGKKISDFGLKQFFRLHPPRKGIKSKLAYPKGVLGDNGKNINKLIERML